MTYNEIVEFIARTPRIPRWELRIHPSVMAPLREHVPASPSFLELASSGLLLSGIPVIEHEDYPEGMWRLYKDGMIHDFGFITTPEECS